MNTVTRSSQELSVQNSVQANVEYTVIDRKTAKAKNLNKFFTGVKCNNGHFSQRYVGDGKCVKCVSERNYKRYDKDERKQRHNKYYIENSHTVKNYQLKNRTHILEKKKEYRNRKRDELNSKKREWNKRKKKHIKEYKNRNKDYIKIKSKEYYQKNKYRIGVRTKLYNIKNPMGQFVRGTLRRIERAKGAQRLKRASAELGYSQDDFIRHITSKFKKGMSWEKRNEWHIDHIKPISVFLKEGVTDVKVINALSNLQPLWAKENMEKYNKWQ